MLGVDELLGDLGGVTYVAGKLNRPVPTVASWKSRRSIPVKEWPGIIDLARQRKVRNVTYEALALMHASQKEAAQ